MTEEGRPTGLQYEDVVKAAASGGTVEFEGRQVRVVGLQERSGLFEAPSQRITLSGRNGASLRHSPLRTVRAGFLAHGSSNSLPHPKVSCLCYSCVDLLVAVEV